MNQDRLRGSLRKILERKHKIHMKMLPLLALGTALSASLLIAQAPATQPAASHAKPATAKTTAAPPTAAEIADAKAKGLVWANLNTKVYHQSSATQYGTTKNGKFMTEADAKTAGFRAAKDTPAKSAKPAATKK
jgi:hypothetical protein